MYKNRNSKGASARGKRPCREAKGRRAGNPHSGEAVQDVLVGLVTAPPSEAERIAGTIVDRGLAACCNVIPSVNSVFNWKGVRETEAESLILVKTTRGRSQELMDCVREVHPYELPEVVLLPVVIGLDGYLKWVRGECGPREGGG